MTNKEKYAKDLYDIFLNSVGVDEENKPFHCERCVGEKCKFYGDEMECTILAKQWLNEEYKADWSKVPVDAQILVKDAITSGWLHRHFARYENGKVFVWADGATSWTTEDTVCVGCKCARLCKESK